MENGSDLGNGRAGFNLSQGGRGLFLCMPTSSCHRLVLLGKRRPRRFLKLPLAYFSGFGSGQRASLYRWLGLKGKGHIAGSKSAKNASRGRRQRCAHHSQRTENVDFPLS